MEHSISLNPTKEITFRPSAEKQSVVLELRNDWSREVMFKLKTTRAGCFKMRPVFGKIGPNSVTMIKLVFVGFADGAIPARRTDRFTVLMIPSPAGAEDPVKVWSVGKEMEKTATRKVLQIKYKEDATATAVYPKSAARSTTPPTTKPREKARTPSNAKYPTITNMTPTATRTHSVSPKEKQKRDPADIVVPASNSMSGQTEPKPSTTAAKPPTPKTASPKKENSKQPAVASGKCGVRNACAVPAPNQESSSSTSSSESSEESE